MPAAKIAVSLDPEALKEVDRLVQRGVFPSRSSLIQDALAEKLARIRRVRLARNERSGTVIVVAVTSQEPAAGFPLTLEIHSARLPRRC